MDADKTLIKLDEKVIEVAADPKKGGMATKAVSEEELFDDTVLGDGLEKLLKNDFNKIANEAYKGVLDQLRTGIRKSVLSTLGFAEDSWNRGLSVDHCNGRMSAVRDYVSDRVKQVLRDEADKLFDSEKERKSLAKEMAPALKREFKDVFMSEVADTIRQQAQEAATEFVKELVSSEMEKLKPQAIKRARQALLGRANLRGSLENDDEYDNE